MPTAATSEPSYHALLIGIDAYPGQNALFACVNDIDAVERMLLDGDGVGLPPDRVHVHRLAAPHPDHSSAGRRDEAPTKANILRALESLASTALPGDRVLVYYSGHGAQGRVTGLSGWHECLVPVDIDKRLWDVEFNPLILAVAKVTDDVTIVLDSCNSAGATRGSIKSALRDRSDIRTRRFQADANVSFAADTAVVGKAGATERGFGQSPADGPDAGYLLLAAAQNDESAIEQRFGADRHGTLTHFLVQQVVARNAVERATLRWWDIWPQLLSDVVDNSHDQHPRLFGSHVRRVFGGASPDEDPGYSVVALDDGRFAIGAGTLMGVAAGAELAVYGTETKCYSPLGSPEDLAARRGGLRVIAAERGSALAEAIDGAKLTLPAGAKARLIKPATGERLSVAVQPFDPVLAGILAASPLLTVMETAEDFDVIVERSDGQWLIGSRVEEAIARVPADASMTAHAILVGLETYYPCHALLRMGQRCQGGGLDNALAVTLLDCRSLVCDTYGPQEIADADKPKLDECPRDSEGVYALKHGDRVAVGVVNRSNIALEAALFDCTAAGTVEFIDNIQLAPWESKVFWYPLQPRKPFKITLAKERQQGTDQLVVIGTSKRDVNWTSLKQDQRSVQEVVDQTLDPERDLTKSLLDEGDKRGKGIEQWTSTLVPVRIGR